MTPENSVLALLIQVWPMIFESFILTFERLSIELLREPTTLNG